MNTESRTTIKKTNSPNERSGMQSWRRDWTEAEEAVMKLKQTDDSGGGRTQEGVGEMDQGNNSTEWPSVFTCNHLPLTHTFSHFHTNTSRINVTPFVALTQKSELFCTFFQIHVSVLNEHVFVFSWRKKHKLNSHSSFLDGHRSTLGRQNCSSSENKSPNKMI